MVAGVADSRAIAEEMHRSGVMLSLLKSLGRLWPAKGPPAGSEKQPRGVKPRMRGVVVVAFVDVASVVDVVVVMRVEVGEDIEDVVALLCVELDDVET